MDKKMKSNEGNEKRLAEEVVWEILSWLGDPKSLVRFKCVSKLWLDTIEDHWFLLKHSSKQKVCQVMIKADTSNQGGVFSFVMSRHGLVLERNYVEGKFRIVNPYLKHVLDLPDPIKSRYMVIKLIYSSSERKYKLVSYHYKKKDEPTTKSPAIQILTLEGRLIWRNLDIPELTSCLSGINELPRSILIDTVLFILRIDEDYQQMTCFETESEQCSVLNNIPESAITSAGSAAVTYWNKKPAIAKMHGFATVDWKLNVWILEDYKKQRWAQTKISISLSSLSKYFLEDKSIILQHLMDTSLCFSVDHGQKYINCVIKDTDKIIDKPAVNSMPPGYRYIPSLVCLQGMKLAHSQDMLCQYQL